LGVVNTGRPLQVKYWGSRPLQPCGVDAYVHYSFCASCLWLRLGPLVSLRYLLYFSFFE